MSGTTGTGKGIVLLAPTVEMLSDVSAPVANDGDVLTYQAATGQWVAKPTSGGTGTVTNVSAGVGLVASPNPITGAGSIQLANTAVSAGRYTLATVDVDAQGRIVSAVNGAAGTVTSAGVAGNNGITVGGSPITTEGVITLGLGNITPISISTGIVSASTINATGDVQAATGRITASAATISGKLTGATASFSGLVSADGGINTANVSASTASFSGVVSANAGIKTTTLAASSTITGSNLSGTNTGDQTITLTGDVSGSGTGSFTTTINPGVVTFAKMQAVGASQLLGNPTNAVSAVQAISLGATLTFVGSAIQTVAFSGDVSAKANSYSTEVIALRGTPISAGSISDQQVLTYIAGDGKWSPRSVAGSGTVTSVSAGAGLTASPNPITGAGAIQLDTSAQNNWTAQQYFGIQTLTDASAVAWNAKSQQVASLTINGAGRQLQNPTNMQSGATYILWVKGIVASAALTYDTAYKWPGGTAPVISPASGAISILTFICNASAMYGVSQLNFS